jgi:hypothetical protein
MADVLATNWSKPVSLARKLSPRDVFISVVNFCP